MGRLIFENSNDRWVWARSPTPEVDGAPLPLPAAPGPLARGQEEGAARWVGLGDRPEVYFAGLAAGETVTVMGFEGMIPRRLLPRGLAGSRWAK